MPSKDTTYYRWMGEQRATQASFLAHNQAMAIEGWAGYSAHFRARQGLPLLNAWHIQYLRPEDFEKKGDRPLTAEQQRMVYFSYVWKAVWGHIPEGKRPTPPTQEQYEQTSCWVQARALQGLPLEDSLDVIFLAPNDLCTTDGRPYSPVTQKKRFRALFRAACEAALATLSTPRRPGQRVMSLERAPDFSRPEHLHTTPLVYGRPDLPPYDQRNIVPQRPYQWPT